MDKIIILFLLHAAGDFILQGDKLSSLKRSKISYLLIHTGLYTAVFLVATPFILGLSVKDAILFSLFNGVIHLVVDYFTGKAKEKYWEQNQQAFVTIVGVDHTLHLFTLILSYLWSVHGIIPVSL